MNWRQVARIIVKRSDSIFSWREQLSKIFCSRKPIVVPEWSNNEIHNELQCSLINDARFHIQSVSVDKVRPSDGPIWLPSAQARAQSRSKLVQLYSSAMDNRNSCFVGWKMQPVESTVCRVREHFNTYDVESCVKIVIRELWYQRGTLKFGKATVRFKNGIWSTAAQFV